MDESSPFSISKSEMHSIRRMIFLVIIAFSATSNVAILPSTAGDRSGGTPMPVVPPGVAVPGGESLSDATRWNQLILLAKPEIHSGDISAMSASVKKSATQCALTLLATVGVDRDGDEIRFRLKEVGVGYSVPVSGRSIIVTSETSAQLGASLGFIGRQVLRKNQAALANVRIVGQSDTLRIFDAPSVMLLGKSHQHCVTRHLIWIDPGTGKGALLAWLLKPPRDSAVDTFTCINQPMRLVRLGTIENRLVHVDGSQFTFGIPSETAVALEDLPPGTDIAWSDEAKAIASRNEYSNQEIAELSAKLNAAIANQLQR